MVASSTAAISASGQVQCVGCGGLVPEMEGSTHAYMQASPGCWTVYGQLIARITGAPDSPVTAWHHVDCYAVQHPGGAEHDRRQRQSVAVHLTTLCLLLEQGLPAGQAFAVRGRLSRTVLPAFGLPDWPYLTPPTDVCPITAIDVHAATDPVQLAGQVHAWAETAWAAWDEHHSTVRTWATTALSRKR